MAKVSNSVGTWGKVVIPFVNERDIKIKSCSNVFIKQYTEIPPYTRDADGSFLNETSEPILKEIEPLNVDEYIQSFRDDVELGTILKRAISSGDKELLNVVPEESLQYGDVSRIPDNMNDAHNVKRAIVRNAVNSLGGDIVSDILDGKDITSKLDELLDKRFKERFPDYDHNGKKIETGGND